MMERPSGTQVLVVAAPPASQNQPSFFLEIIKLLARNAVCSPAGTTRKGPRFFGEDLFEIKLLFFGLLFLGYGVSLTFMTAAAAGWLGPATKNLWSYKLRYM